MNGAKRRRMPIAPAWRSSKWKPSFRGRNTGCTNSVLRWIGFSNSNRAKKSCWRSNEKNWSGTKSTNVNCSWSWITRSKHSPKIAQHAIAPCNARRRQRPASPDWKSGAAQPPLPSRESIAWSPKCAQELRLWNRRSRTQRRRSRSAKRKTFVWRILLGDTSIATIEGEALAQEEAFYREMRTKLDNMGPVNMMALEEYKETAQRHEFLEVQRKDLLDSIENTQNTIREIDEFSKQKFDEAFAKINENFQVTFRKLFGGGHGFMKLTDEENSAESGIDIVASPPGKKLQNVLLLSGGEKALTALSLLVGIFQYQPSPFCILDEVDAPLDESNVGRFTELVKEMSDRTQFIVITHHKRTISSSPVLYGVTMQEPGVSKVVSVRFGEEQSKVQMAATA
ncbi:MAG: hypothetical protein DMG63_19075 [Acidobacteria bacterium]|nr:MAG: hypothetical protein DMG63_19075 [Acidobacteriota bacterium]